MKLLHTADWHVGKSIKGQPRLDEHRSVLAEIVDVASREQPDLVLIVGDLYETATPTPEAQAVVMQALLDLRETGATVVALAGNHDNAHQLDSIRPVFAALGMTVIGLPRRPRDGGLLEIDGPSDPVRLALLPFCSQRSVIRSAQLMAEDGAENAGTYAERVRLLIERLSNSFRDDAVNVIAAHCMVEGAKPGGGEREAQTFMDYWVKATAFPANAHYVALGHLHRTQQIGAACPIWYSGSPLQVDFGEEEHAKHVLLVEATPTTPAQVREVPITSGRRMRTLRGTLDELRAIAGTTNNDFLRVIVNEPARAGLAENIRELLGDTVMDVRLDPAVIEAAQHRREQRAAPQGASPQTLFNTYLAECAIEDDRLEKLFATLLDEELT